MVPTFLLRLALLLNTEAPPCHISIFICDMAQASPEAVQSTIGASISEDGYDEKSVDPMSLQQSTRMSEVQNMHQCLKPPLPLPPAKSKFVSCSLPNSATSSPQSKNIFRNLKKWRNQGHAVHSLARHKSSTVSPFALEGSMLRKSKSCGEGRSSMHIQYDEFDLYSKSLRGIEFSEDLCRYATYEVNGNNIKQLDSRVDIKFKCGACLFMPGFAKGGKPVRPRKQQVHEETDVISRTVSLEKFECASWASPAVVSHGEAIGSMSSYFDLPSELIRESANGTNSPVSSAFVFERKGVLKTCTSGGGNSKTVESPRHVRFSMSSSQSDPSSPSSVSPSMRKARDVFYAYFQAQ